MSILDWFSPSAAIGKLLSSTFVQPLITGGVDAYKAKLGAENNTDKILADVVGKELVVEQRQRELDALQNQMEQGTWFTRYPRAIVQWSLSIYIAKVVVWDMVLGLGTTPDIKSTLVANAFNLIVVMWFGGRTLEKMTSTVISRIK